MIHLSQTKNAAVKVYVELLDEGTETWRPTTAVALGNGLFEIQPTPDYDPEDEAWAFLPGAVVKLEEKRFSDGKHMAARHPNPKVIRIEMPLVDMKIDLRPTSALDLGNGLYEILPTPQYNPKEERWKFPPGSIVKLEKRIWSGGDLGTFLEPVERGE